MRKQLGALAVCALLTGTPAALAQNEGTRQETPAQAAQPVKAGTASGYNSTPLAVDQKQQQEEKAGGGSEAFRTSPSVVKLGGMLGMKPAVASAAFEWLNFLVLAAAIGYGLLKALPKVFHGRTADIQKNIVEARLATEEANLRLAAVEERLSRLDGEIAAIREQSERETAEEAARVKQQLAEETGRILQAAEQEIAAASAQAGRSLRAYAAEIAVDRASQRLEISAEDDRALIQSFAARLTAAGSRN